jgi:hypothetical protein
LQFLLIVVPDRFHAFLETKEFPSFLVQQTALEALLDIKAVEL